jgi:enamine deaminase RidA (YjgF/YER057c/UK114 family)
MTSTSRQHVSSGTAWESQVGYARAVRVGSSIHVAGTTATDEQGNIVGAGDAYAQTVQILRTIQRALQALDADMEHVVRTRIYVTDIDRWQEVGRAHGEFFADIRPAATMVEVRRLIAPELLVEIEAEAVVAGGAQTMERRLR